MRHRQRAQITPLVLFAVIILIGAVALVIDAGVFFVTQRQLQTAVDAAVLEAAWYSPACDPTLLHGGTDGCQISAASLPPTTWSCTDSPPAQCVANAVLQKNLGFIGQLCGGTPNPPNVSVNAYGTTGLSEYTIGITCTAPYWFANIFPNMPTMQISAKAAAAVGYANPTNTDLAQTPTTPTSKLMSRLLPFPSS